LYEAEEESGSFRNLSRESSIVRYATIGARKALGYIPLLGSILTDFVDFGEVILKERQLERLSHGLAAALERFMPAEVYKENAVCPMLTWTTGKAGMKL